MKKKLSQLMTKKPKNLQSKLLPIGGSLPYSPSVVKTYTDARLRNSYGRYQKQFYLAQKNLREDIRGPGFLLIWYIARELSLLEYVQGVRNNTVPFF